VSIFLTLGFSFSAQATESQCSDIFAFKTERPIGSDAQVVAENALKWGNFFKAKASPSYQKIWNHYFNLYYRYDLVDMKNQGAAEAKLLEKIGFNISSASIETPGLETFVIELKKYLDLKKIPLDHRIMPAITYFPVGKPDEVMLHIPLVEPWTENVSNYRTKTDLRLKGRQMTEALAGGRFPLFAEGGHDIFHLLSFALYPDYAKALRDGNRNLLKTKLTIPVLSRSTYMLEVLALGDSKKVEEIKQHLTIHSPNQEHSFDDFLQAIENLSPQELRSKEEFWQANFQKYLIHYAAGMAEPREREVYADEIRRKDFSIFLKNFYEGTEYNPKNVLPFEILYDGMTHMDVILEVLVSTSYNSQGILNSLFARRASNGKEELQRLIRLQIARMEYALWKSTTEITVEQWAQDTMIPVVDPESPTLRFIKDCFGPNSVTYRKFTH
jgi:hypothetical protein